MPRERVFWTKHAIVEALEDGFAVGEVEEALGSLAEIPGSEPGKVRGVARVGDRYCTVVLMRMRAGIRIITCWASSTGDINEYKKVKK